MPTILPFPSSSLHNHLTHLPKCKSDSVISLLKLIQGLLRTCRINGFHVAKQTYKDLEEAASYVSGTSPSSRPGVQCLADLQSHEHTILTLTPPPATFSFSCAPSLCRGSQPLFPAIPHLLLTCPVLSCPSRLSSIIGLS